MKFQEHRRAIVRKTLEDVKLPQRLGGIQGPRKDPPDGPLELPPTAGRRDRGPAQMEVEVEPLIVHPQRPGEPERHPKDPLAQARREVDARLHDPLDVFVGERAVGPRSEYRDSRHMHVHRRALQIQEARVKAGQAFRRHRGSLPFATHDAVRGC